jgi:hypothetical protein
MKRLFTLISIFIILLIGTIWLTLSKRESKSHPQVTKSPAMHARVARQPQAKDEFDKENYLKQIKRNDEIKLEKEAAQIRDDLFKAASVDDKKAFGARMIDLMDRFTGDPRLILHELTPFLQHKNESIAGVVASAFLRSRIATNEATACLLQIMARPGPLIEPKIEEDYLDIRLGVASILSQYPSDEISDAVWKLYERTKEKRLFGELLRLKNPNLPTEIIPILKEHGAVLDLIGIISQYRIQEALEPLFQWYNNKYFMREGDGDKRIGVLWGLWRLTGEEKYRSEFMGIAGMSSIKYLANEGTAEAEKYLSSMLPEARGDSAQRLVMVLHLKYGNPPELKEFIRNVYLKRGAPPIPAEMLHNITSTFDDPELNVLAEKSFSPSEGPGLWRRYGVYRKGWALPEWTGGTLDIP